jgi:hypothetical protein
MCNLSDGIFELGCQEGESRVLSLIQKLLEVGGIDDVKRVADDKEYSNLLMKELKII